MRKIYNKKRGNDGLFKFLWIEVRDTILFDLFLNILTFIPRMIIRFIKQLF